MAGIALKRSAIMAGQALEHSKFNLGLPSRGSQLISRSRPIEIADLG
jgi:hypothetical protein